MEHEHTTVAEDAPGIEQIAEDVLHLDVQQHVVAEDEVNAGGRHAA